MNLEDAKSKYAEQIANGPKQSLNPRSTMYLYTDTVYYAVGGYELLMAGGYYPKSDVEMLHDIIIAIQSLGSKYHANELVHYLFVSGRKPGDKLPEALESLLKTHVRFYGLQGHHGLEDFYRSISRNLNKSSQEFLEEDVFNVG